MAKIRLDDNFDLEKFDPYKDTLVTTVCGTAEEVKEVLDKLMGDETNKIKRNTVSLRQKWISVKERMPEKSMLVLGVVHGHVGELAYINDRNVFERREHLIEGVTHWMPLPDAPEVEDE